MLNQSVQELATQLRDALEHKSRTNGDEFVCLKDGSPQWMTDVVRSVHGDKLPDDTTYAFISQCADAIAESEEPNDAIYEIEPDTSTHDLTGWLHARNDHVYYLSEVLEECSPTDGFSLLAMAQQKHIHEVGSALVSALESALESADVDDAEEQS
jgi:hypothetical protein